MKVRVDLTRHPLYGKSACDFYKKYTGVWEADLLSLHLEKGNCRLRVYLKNSEKQTLDISTHYIIGPLLIVNTDNETTEKIN